MMSSKQQQQQQQQAAPNNKRRAYVTFLAGDGDYWKGVVGLAKGLRRVRSAYPLVVAVLPDVPEEHRRKLRGQGCVVREIQPVYPPESQTQFAMAYYVINYSKLRIWELVEYERMVYLDADIQVLDNIDHLLDLDKGRFYAVMDCFCEKTWSHTPQYKIGYCQQCPERVPWPEQQLGPPPPPYFNAGMFVHEPSLGTAKELLDALVATPPTPFAEQDFLNMFFRDVYTPIPPVYNLVLAMLWRHPDKVEPLAEVNIKMEVHGAGAQHGAPGHQDARRQVVGRLQRRQPRLQGRRRRPAAAAPGSGGGRRRQLLPGALGGLIST
ncbi:hypothetical protein PVAP13_2KG570400 [Panicum virgatum]|uniref:Hexosyltransferase n=1 Tax=Panicum virgatum TaxID=38727 RepID=A0A8T0WI52_PANVG|nr:hypothetical protein PVAP13_2KG570400 [Panicum virgatum]